MKALSFVYAVIFGALLHGALSWVSETCLKVTQLWCWFLTENYFSSNRAIFKCIFCVSIFDNIWLLVTPSTAAIASCLYCCVCSAYLYCYPYIKEPCQRVWHQEEVEGGTPGHTLSYAMSATSALSQHLWLCFVLSERMKYLNHKAPPLKSPPLGADF